MTSQELLQLGFKDTTWSGNTEHTLETADFKIEVSGISLVEINVDGDWITVPNCNTIDDMKQLIKLFSKGNP
jgi:hypothetical protein